jgi:toxin ParE1/3/4
MGKQRSELAPLLRSFPVKNYLIFYRPIDEGIEIVRILHGSQDIETLF